jgi:hypothetical protein
MSDTWFARLGIVTAVGILSVVTHVAQASPQRSDRTSPPPFANLHDSRIFTTGTVGAGTASSVAVPDLGSVTAECSATGRGATATVTGDLVFDWFVATSPVGSSGKLNQTSWTSDKVSETLWLKNVQGQWRLEYFALPSETGTPSICQVAVTVTRIS